MELSQSMSCYKNKKMRRIAIFVYILSVFPCVASGADYLEEVESEVYQANGTVQEISRRAKTCIVQLVHNDEVRISDSASGTGPFSIPIGGGPGHSSGIQGGPVIVDADIDAGTITANNRVDYTSKFLAHNVKSTITFLAKEGRFKIRHTNIEYLQKSTGSVHNTGYSHVGKWWGSGWEDAREALLRISARVATCVQTLPKKEDW